MTHDVDTKRCPECDAQMDPERVWWWGPAGAVCSEGCAVAITQRERIARTPDSERITPNRGGAA